MIMKKRIVLMLLVSCMSSFTACSSTTPLQKVEKIENYADEAIGLAQKAGDAYDEAVDSALENEDPSSIKYTIADFLKQWNEFDDYGMDYLANGAKASDSASGSTVDTTLVGDIKNHLDHVYTDQVREGQLYPVQLKRVVDGDTFIINNEQKVNLRKLFLLHSLRNVFTISVEFIEVVIGTEYRVVIFHARL